MSPKPKFKAGQRVEYVDNATDVKFNGAEPIWATATVERIEEGRRQSIIIRPDDPRYAQNNVPVVSRDDDHIREV